jgi:nitrogen PTS system EIIA component
MAKNITYLGKKPAVGNRQRIERMHDLVTPATVAVELMAATKKALFTTIADRMAASLRLTPHAIFDVLWQREQLGSTGCNQGVAIPHGRIKGIDRPHGFFAQLDQAIAYDAPDGKPVDLVFAVLAPTDAGADHLKALAVIAQVLRDEAFCARARRATDDAQLYALIQKEAGFRAA